MTYILPPLPYAQDALEPYISASTLSFHYSKHHQTYVTNLNKFVENTDMASLPLEEIIKRSAKDASQVGIFNNAAQVWNHTFYWHCMKPQGGGAPDGKIAELIDRDFDNYNKFKEEFKQAAVSQFGSGWAWLILKGNKLSIMKTGNADLPMAHDARALLTCDVWEHAYYLDYQNRRSDYVETFLQQLVNWDFVNENLSI